MTRLYVVLAAVALVACSDDKPAATAEGDTKAEGAKKDAPKGRRGAAAAEGAGGGEATGEEVAPPKVEFQETDFTETDRSRDPFRPYADLFVEQAKNKVRSQLHVVAKEYSVDELKLVGLVTRIHPPRAMFVDPTGRGHVIDHGDFLGRPEIVHGGTTTADYEIHWRVDQVRETDVVLVREDPANPDVPSATRVVPLRTEDALLQQEP